MGHCNRCDAPVSRCGCSVPVSVEDRIWGTGEEGELTPVEFLQLLGEREPQRPQPDTITLDQAITLIRLALAVLGVSVPADQVRKVAARVLLDMPK